MSFDLGLLLGCGFLYSLHFFLSTSTGCQASGLCMCLDVLHSTSLCVRTCLGKHPRCLYSLLMVIRILYNMKPNVILTFTNDRRIDNDDINILIVNFSFKMTMTLCR